MKVIPNGMIWTEANGTLKDLNIRSRPSPHPQPGLPKDVSAYTRPMKGKTEPNLWLRPHCDCKAFKVADLAYQHMPANLRERWRGRKRSRKGTPYDNYMSWAIKHTLRGLPCPPYPDEDAGQDTTHVYYHTRRELARWPAETVAWPWPACQTFGLHYAAWTYRLLPEQPLYRHEYAAFCNFDTLGPDRPTFAIVDWLFHVQNAWVMYSSAWRNSPAFFHNVWWHEPTAACVRLRFNRVDDDGRLIDWPNTDDKAIGWRILPYPNTAWAWWPRRYPHPRGTILQTPPPPWPGGAWPTWTPPNPGRPYERGTHWGEPIP